MKTVKELLIAGRQAIITKGWWQWGVGTGPNGEVCMLNSLGSGFPSVEDQVLGFSATVEAETALRKAIAKKHYTNSSIVVWNDKPGRTVEEVLEVYDIAIRDCE